MDKPIKILHLEDEPGDSELMEATLEEGNIAFDLTRVQTKEEYRSALVICDYDIIISDYRLPMFDGISAMKMAREHCPDIPFIFLSGTMGEDIAIETLTHGATDYVLKHKLSRIVPAINRAFLEAKGKSEQKRIEQLMEVRLRIVETIYASDLSLDEICTLVIDEIESQTGSTIGFFGFLEKDQKTISCNYWSTRTLASVSAEDLKKNFYGLLNQGDLSDCIDHKQPVIYNDYASFSQGKGDSPVVRELIVPIVRNDLVVAFIGIGNKTTDYDETDVKVISLLGDFSWEIIRRKVTEQHILRERENFYKTLTTAPVGILLVDSDMVITQTNYAISSLVSREIDEIVNKPIGDGLGCIHSTLHSGGSRVPGVLPVCPLQQELLNVIKEEKSLRSKELIFSRMHDGKQLDYWLNVNIEPVTIDDAKYYIVAIDDVTEKKKLEQERLDNVHFLEGLDRVNRSMQGTNDLEQMMNNVLEIVLSIFNCDRAFLVYPCDPEAKTWQIKMEVANPDYPGIGTDEPVKTNPETARIFREIIERGSPVQLGPEDVRLAFSQSFSEEMNVESVIVMAVFPKEGKPWMLGMQQCSSARTWTGEEVRLFQEIGRRIENNLTTLLMYREVQTLLRELYHRTKNNMMVICSLMNLHSHFHKQDETVTRVLKEMENRIRSMALVHEKLYQSQNLSSINMKVYIQDEIQSLINSYGIRENIIHFNLDGIDDVSLLIDSAVPCGLIINELVTNAIKYAFPEGREGTITIIFNKDKKDYCNLQVSDDGVGVDKDFNFRVDQKMGLMLITNVVEGQLMGEISFENKNGITYYIRFKDIYYRERV